MITLDVAMLGQDLFDKLDREAASLIKEFNIQRSEGLTRIIKGFENPYTFGRDLLEFLFQEHIQLHPYSAKDIENFSILLIGKHENDYYNGVRYLNALMYHSDENEFLIHTRHLPYLMYGLGVRNNGKYIIIDGNVGDMAGGSMNSGILEIRGNVYGSGLGYLMKGGKIHVKGSVEIDKKPNSSCLQVGNTMKGGEIYIEGSVNYRIGCRMMGGVIHVSGRKPKISMELQGGNIYHKGKLIVKDGVRVE